MKKRKISLWLNVVTICLSICAIAIGVYSIKTASLNINGSIGFTAHDCNVSIVTSMYGDSAASDTPTAESVVSGVIRSEENAKKYDTINAYSSTETLKLGALYFCDKTENGKVNPITLSFTITNISAYNYIDVTVNQNCINNERISIYAPNNGETLAPRASMTLTIQFQLKQGGSSLENNIDFTDATLLNFEKSQAPAYLATDWQEKIVNNFSLSDLSSITKMRFLRELKTDTLTGFIESPVSVGAVNETSTAGNLTTNVSDVVAYYNSTSKEIIIYSQARIYAPQNCKMLFNFMTSLTSLDLTNFDTNNVTNMYMMFYNLNKLTELDLSSIDTSCVTNMCGMFESCNGLTSLNISNFNTRNVTNMSWMFLDCSSLTSLDVTNFDTREVTDMSNMFASCTELTNLDVSNFDTGKVKNMLFMFQSCSKLTSLDVTNFNTSNVTNMGDMFYYCSGLTSLDLSSFNTINVTNMESMFYYCSGLTSLDLSSFNTINVTNMESMFYGCSNLKTVYIGSGWNTNAVTSSTNMFKDCTSLPDYSASHVDVNYARPISEFGYLTIK